METWKIVKVIVKSGDDLRQEQFAMQLISQMKQIFSLHGGADNLWLFTYEIISTGPNCGLVECIPNAVSLDALKKKTSEMGIKTLNEFFCNYYSNKKGKFII